MILKKKKLKSFLNVELNFFNRILANKNSILNLKKKQLQIFDMFKNYVTLLKKYSNFFNILCYYYMSNDNIISYLKQNNFIFFDKNTKLSCYNKHYFKNYTLTFNKFIKLDRYLSIFNNNFIFFNKNSKSLLCTKRSSKIFKNYSNFLYYFCAFSYGNSAFYIHNKSVKKTLFNKDFYKINGRIRKNLCYINKYIHNSNLKKNYVLYLRKITKLFFNYYFTNFFFKHYSNCFKERNFFNKYKIVVIRFKLINSFLKNFTIKKTIFN